MQRITKSQAQKLFWAGHPILLCPCKLHPGRPFSPAALITSAEWMERAARYRDNPTLWAGTLELTAWKIMHNNWEWANSLNKETGTYASYYVEE